MKETGGDTRFPVGSNSWGAAARSTLTTVPAPGLIVLGMLCRQLGAVTAKPLFSVVGPLAVTTLRLGCSAVVLLFVWRSAVRVGSRALPLIVGCGITLAGMNLAFYQAIARMPLGPTVAIELLGPLAVGIFGSRRLLDAVWALLAGLGVVLLVRSGNGIEWAGVLFALTAAMSWVGYIVLGSRLSNRTGDGAGLALSMVCGAILTLPIGIGVAGDALLQPRVLLVGFVMALLSSVIPYSLEFRSLRQIPARVFGVLMSLEPAIAALLGLVILSEKLYVVQWLSVILVIIASLGVTGRRRTF